MLILLLLAVSFLSLFLAIFWIMLIRTHERQFGKEEKITKYPNVTVLVPSKNGSKTIAATIKSILASHYPKDKLQIIVALNGCTDKTADVVKPFLGKHVKLVEYSFSNKARAMNKSLRLATGEIVSCVDDDSIVDKDAIRNMVILFQDENVGAAIPICRVINPKTFLEKVQSVEYQVSTFGRRLLSAIDSLFTTPGVLGTYRKKILQKVGGFDEKSLTEDIEVAMRIAEAGYLVRSQLLSKTYTTVPTTLRAFDRQRLRWARGFLESIWKHKQMLFNPKHGFLGMFILPLFVLISILVAIVSLVVVYTLGINLYFFLYNLVTLNQIYIYSSTFMWFNPVLIITTFLLVLAGAYLLNKSYKHTKGQWAFPVATLFYFTFYQTVISFYWLRAFVYTFVNAPRKW